MINFNIIGPSVAEKIESPYGESLGTRFVERIQFEGFKDLNHSVAIARKINCFDQVFNLYIRYESQGNTIYINKNSLKKRFSNTDAGLKFLAAFFPEIPKLKEIKGQKLDGNKGPACPLSLSNPSLASSSIDRPSTSPSASDSVPEVAPPSPASLSGHSSTALSRTASSLIGPIVSVPGRLDGPPSSPPQPVPVSAPVPESPPPLPNFPSLNFLDPLEQAEIFKHVRRVKRPELVAKKVHHLARSILLAPEGNFLLRTSTKNGDEIIGTGSYKTVKVAVNLETGVKRVVGVIRRMGKKDRIVLSDSAWKSNLEELRLLQRFKGKEGIIQLDTAFVTENPDLRQDKIYMVMEYCDGGDLYKILIEKPIYLTNRDRFQIARDSAIGLRNMHAEGILNRDVKMENVITFRGDDRLIHSKLTDMGFACGRDDFEERKKPCGSLEYQSPERATALKSNDSDEVAACTTEANDVWPLGMVFYTLFHPGKSALRFHYQVCANRQGGLSLIAGLQQDAIDREIENSGMNPQFIPLVKGMLKVDPVHRFSMVQVVQELDRIKPFFEFPNSL